MRPDDALLLALAESAEVRAYLAQPNTGVYIVRSNGDIVWASPSMKEVVGRTPKELVGGNGWDILVPPEVLPQVAEFRAHLVDADGTVWMPLVMPGGGREWYRVEAMLRAGGILCAFRRDPEPVLRRVHWRLRERRGG